MTPISQAVFRNGSWRAEGYMGSGGTEQPRYGWNTLARVRGIQASCSVCSGHINFSGPGPEVCSKRGREVGETTKLAHGPHQAWQLYEPVLACWVGRWITVELSLLSEVSDSSCHPTPLELEPP